MTQKLTRGPVRQTLDPHGKKMDIPRVLSGKFMRNSYVKKRYLPQNVDLSQLPAENMYVTDMFRAQIPWVVTVHEYVSRHQITPDVREFYLYAPPELSTSAMVAKDLWKAWFKPATPGEISTIPISEDYPKIDDLIIACPITDREFKDLWKHCRDIPHLRRAGDPSDPFAFTDHTGNVKLYRTTDPAEGLILPSTK